MTQKEGFSCLVLGLLLDGLWFLVGTLSAQKRKLHFNYVFLYVNLCVLLGFYVDS